MIERLFKLRIIKLSAVLLLSLLMMVILLPNVVGYADNSDVADDYHPDTTPSYGEDPPIKGGKWEDNFRGSNLSVLTNTTRFYGGLILKLDEYLYWTQTDTEHFATGMFFQTEAISDAVQMSLTGGGTQYLPTGIYTSTIFDAGAKVDWSRGTWSYFGSFNELALEFRTGDTPVPDNSWQAWAKPLKKHGSYMCLYYINLNITECYSILREVDSSHYIQYKATFTNTNVNETIALFDVEITHGTHVPTGTAISSLIRPIDLGTWDTIFYTATVPVSTALTIDILSNEGKVLLSNLKPNDSLAAIDSSLYPSIKLRTSFVSTDTSLSPEIDTWGITWIVSNKQYLPIVLK